MGSDLKWAVAFVLVCLTVVAIASPSNEQIRRDEIRRATERLRQQIRTHHGVDARVLCTDGGDRELRCVAVIRDVPTYFRCDRYRPDGLCLPVNGGAR